MRFLIAFTCLLFVLSAPVMVRADDDLTSAKAYVDHVASDALATIKSNHDGKLSTNAAKTQFREILNDAFDIPTIARFTLGKYWRVATPAEQKEYTRLLQTVILEKYADRLLEFSGDRYTVDGAQVLNDRDTVVNSTIYPLDKPATSFDWRLRKNGKSFKIIDMSVEGISMSVTHRTDFASVIESHGGSVHALLDALKDKETVKHLGQ